MKKTVWIAIGFVVLVVGLVVSTTFQGERVRVEVCMAFAATAIAGPRKPETSRMRCEPR